MKLSKLEGIKFLEAFNMPTIKRLDILKILKGQTTIENGISVRLSPKYSDMQNNVYLPSIHGCKDIVTISQFVQDNRGKYDVFAHETVRPEAIGSISKLENTGDIFIETYKNFEDRKSEIIDNRMTIPVLFDRMLVSHYELLKEDKNDFNNFRKVLMYLKDIPFNQYDMEYVIQNEDVIFTEVALSDRREYLWCKAYVQEKDEYKNIFESSLEEFSQNSI